MNRYLKSLSVGAISFLGLVAGHGLGYFVLEPHSVERAALLAGTGHGYIASLPEYAVTAFMAFLVSGMAWGFRARGEGRSGLRWSRAWFGLAVLQTAGFLVMELTESFGSSGHLSHLVPILAIGLPVQVVVAAFGARLLLAVKRLGEKVAKAFCRDVTAAAFAAWPIPSTETCESLSGSTTRVRGPPIPSY